jgi:Gluconate 2-dehydrogenase subunit 3
MSAPDTPDDLQTPPPTDSDSAGIGRRALLQSLVGGIGAGFALPGLVDAHPMQQHAADHTRTAAAQKKAAAAAYKPEFLDAHQFATLEVLAERIVPGSTDAKVAPFIDQLLAVDSQTNQRNFYGALGAFEMLAIEKYSKPWKALSPAQQDELLTLASTAESGRSRPGPDMDPRQAAQPAGKATIRDHFDNLRGWISGAYYSSEAGMKELGWTGQMFFDKLPGCEHAEGHQ